MTDPESPTTENGLPHPVADVTGDEVVQVVLTAQSFDWMQRQLRARGLYLFPIPVESDDLRTFGVGIGDDVMARVIPPERTTNV